MSRLKLLWLLLALPFVAQAQNMRLTGWCQQGGQAVKPATGNANIKAQRSYPACTVTVYVYGTLTLATIYSDRSSTPLSNPFTANSTTGQWFFYAADGRYDLNFSGANISPPFTIGDVIFISSGGGGGGGGTPGGTPGQVQTNVGGTSFGGITVTGDATLNTVTGAITLATVNADTGPCGDATHVSQVTLNAKGLVTGCTPVLITGSGGSTTPGGSNNQLQYNNAGAFGGFTATGDASITPSTGAVVVSATNGVAFAPSATTNALVASNISSGTLPAGRLPAFTGDVTSPAGSAANTLATVNANIGLCGDATHVAQVTLNAKGLTTGCTAVAIGGSPSAWSSLGNPTAALGLVMAAYPTTLTWNAVTGSGDLFKFTDTLNNTGTGILVHPTTASGSTETPFQADVNGVGWRIAPSTGYLEAVGFGSTAWATTGIVGTPTNTPAIPSGQSRAGFDTTLKTLDSMDDGQVLTKYVGTRATVSLTAQVAAISTANLCTTAQCGTAGQYRVTAFIPSTVVCATPGPGIVGLTIGWTDDASAKTLKFPLAGTGLSGADVTLGQTTAFGSLVYSFWSTGAAAITYATNYTACTTGTGTYSLRLAVERLQ